MRYRAGMKALLIALKFIVFFVPFNVQESSYNFILCRATIGKV